jgi:quinoprotein dehydrogenase-associated probable ABC transporter substrate-binding protein
MFSRCNLRNFDGDRARLGRWPMRPRVGPPRRKQVQTRSDSRCVSASREGAVGCTRGGRAPQILITIFLLIFCASVVAETPPKIEKPKRILHIAADPNNLPFTNDRLEGFEDKIAEIIARELDAKIEYTWHAQRRGFFRQTMKEGDADIVLGVPSHFERTLTTKSYYRSSYVFVSRKDKNLNITSLDDPRLRDLKIGVLLIGDDGVNTPPAHALASRNIITNVVGFSIYGDYAQQNPPARIIDAVAKNEIDLAIVWGPLAGYFATKESVPLALHPVTPEREGPFVFAFDISIGVKRKDKQLRDDINRVLAEKHSEIQKILNDFGVPQIPMKEAKAN